MAWNRASDNSLSPFAKLDKCFNRAKAALSSWSRKKVKNIFVRASDLDKEIARLQHLKCSPKALSAGDSRLLHSLSSERRHSTRDIFVLGSYLLRPYAIWLCHEPENQLVYQCRLPLFDVDNTSSAIFSFSAEGIPTVPFPFRGGVIPEKSPYLQLYPISKFPGSLAMSQGVVQHREL